VADLWRTLGYDSLALEMVEGLGESSDIRVVQGVPGVGKSWLAKGIGAMWESAGGGVVVAEGDSTRSDVSLYPFGIAMDKLDGGLGSLAPAIAALAKAGELFLGTGGVLTTSIEALVKLQARRRKKPTTLLDRHERDVLFNLAKLSQKRPLLVIADNLHWWDSASLEFLSRLRAEHIAEAFPFLNEMRILAVETVEPYQSVAHPEAHSQLLLPQFTRASKLDGIPREGFEDVLVALGAPHSPSPEHTDLIYKFSGGHLVLAHRCAARLQAGEAEGFLSAEDSDEFVEDLLSERVRTLGAPGEEALGVLQVAAVSGLTFRRDALVCAAGISEADTSRLLRYCNREDVLELRNGTGKFVHDFYRQYFLKSIGEERIGIHEVLGDCMRKLDPADYESRCINALEAERPDEAAALAVQVALQRQRDGLPWRGASDTILAAMEDGDLTWVAERFEVAFEHLNHYRSNECLHALVGLPHELPTCLVAEADYLRATCLMTTRSERDRRDAQVILESWSDYVKEEPELGLRLMRLRLYHLALQVSKEPALRLESEIRQILQGRQSYDHAAKDALYTLDRLATSTQRPDRALDMNRRAVEYFGPGDGKEVLRRPVEYYLSLVNLGANLIWRASYEEASQVHHEIERLMDSYEPDVFPRVDYPMSNALLGEYRTGAVGIAEAVDRQREIVASHKVPDDPFFAENALAAYLTIYGSTEEALKVFDRVAALLASRGDPEPSLVYLIRGNRCAARFLSGMTSEARTEWADLAKIVTEIPYDSRPEMLRRHQLLAEVMSEDGAITAKDFDEVLLDRHALGPELERGFWLPAVEWWR
jgi:tetratricopeptide (TPR) repeat protein